MICSHSQQKQKTEVKSFKLAIFNHLIDTSIRFKVKSHYFRADLFFKQVLTLTLRYQTSNN